MTHVLLSLLRLKPKRMAECSLCKNDGEILYPIRSVLMGDVKHICRMCAVEIAKSVKDNDIKDIDDGD
jgi:hypothetical protein